MSNYSFKAVQCHVVMYLQTDCVYKSSLIYLWSRFQVTLVSSELYDKAAPQLIAVFNSYEYVLYELSGYTQLYRTFIENL